MKRRAALLLLGLFLAAAPRAAGGSDNPQADYEALFGAEARRVAESDNPASHAAFAAKLLAAAGRIEDSPALQTLVAEKALVFALKTPTAYETGLGALKLLETLAPARRVEWLAKRCLLEKARAAAARGPAVTDAALDYLDALMVYAAQAAPAGKLKEAEDAYTTAAAIARKHESPRREEAAAGLQWVAALGVIHRRGEALKERVAKNPNDLPARTALVYFLLSESDAPDQAAKFLHPDLEEALRTYVPLAGKPHADLPRQTLGELAAWYASAVAKDASPSGKANALARAKACYESFLASDSRDVAWLKAKTALEDVNARLAQLPRHGRPAAASGPAMSLTRGLLVHLPMERIERSFTPDAGPRGLHARAPSDLRGVPGRIGKGGLFDGRHDQLYIPDSPALNPTAGLSIAAWVKAFGWEGNSRIVQKGLNDNQYRLVRENGSLRFSVAGVGEASCETPSSGSWHHLAGTYDGKVLRLYVDGVSKASKEAAGRIPVTRDGVFIASKSASAVQGDHFHGILDEVRLYNRALTPREVEMLALTGAK